MIVSFVVKNLAILNKFFLFPPLFRILRILFQFNDSTFHFSCLQNHPLGKRALQYAEDFYFKTRPENRISSITGKLIIHPDDYIFLDLLTSDSQDKLYEFNFVTLDKSNIKKWIYRGRFINAAKLFSEQNKWGDLGAFKYLDNLISIMKD